MVTSDPGHDVLGLIRLHEERIEQGLLGYWRCSRSRSGEEQRYAWAVSANVARNLHPVAGDLHVHIGNNYGLHGKARKKFRSECKRRNLEP
jgi:hypothetical protein